MRILITGASGFIGRRLVTTLIEAGHEVGGTYIEDETPELGIELYRADLSDLESLETACRAFRPDRVIHLAGLSHVGASFDRAEAYRKVNVEGTENVVRAADAVPVLLASSSEVYGPVPEAEQPIVETREPCPQSPYAESKVASEKAVLGAGGLVVRCFNVVGPGQETSFALPAFARRLAKIAQGAAEPVLKVGNLEVCRDFVHLDDAVAGFAVAIERGEVGGVYNLGTGRSSTVGDLLRRLIRIAGLEVEVEVDPEKFRPADARKLVADSGRLRALGWEPRRELDDALELIWRTATAG